MVSPLIFATLRTGLGIRCGRKVNDRRSVVVLDAPVTHGAIRGSCMSPYIPHASAVDIGSMCDTDLLEAWMDAVRAAELAKRLADSAAEVGDAAGLEVVAGSPDLAELADRVAEAAEATAGRARRAAAAARLSSRSHPSATALDRSG